ncbi:MAG: Rieske 2Fe-2S domain-containing protein [Lysobacter sp.]|nr:Rieske 2Fe-2S domain-containing protein [Lysobacter sp.]
MDSLNSEHGSGELGDPGAGRTLARLDALPQRTPIEIEATIDAHAHDADPTSEASDDADSLIVYRDGDEARVWYNICPHAGRRLDWAPGKFLIGKDGALICAAHGATFELQRGECVAGPCKGQSLREIPVTVIDGDVRIRNPR